MKSSVKPVPTESREILNDIRRLVQAIRLASGDSEKSLGLSAAQLFVLQKLKEQEGLSINDLAQRTLTHQSSVSVIVQKLQVKKLVKKIQSPGDARKFEISLTKKGAFIVKKAPASIQEQLIKALAKMKPKARGEFARAFRTFMETAGIKGEAPMMFEDTLPKDRKK